MNLKPLSLQWGRCDVSHKPHRLNNQASCTHYHQQALDLAQCLHAHWPQDSFHDVAQYT